MIGRRDKKNNFNLVPDTRELNRMRAVVADLHILKHNAIDDAKLASGLLKATVHLEQVINHYAGGPDKGPAESPAD